MARILVTGGAGYIGSHAVLALAEAGHEVVVYDNLSSGHEWAVLAGRLVVGDIRDGHRLDEVLSQDKFDAVIHFAAHISVPESVRQPLKYYSNNVVGSLTLLEALQRHGVRKVVFSSSAAVYGIAEEIPIKEESSLKPINPYGQTKAVVERILFDLDQAGEMRYVSLRYFNVAGADEMNRIGEGKEDAPHIITMCVRTAAGLRPYLAVYGTDYPTFDGTCIRDYIHVSDLAWAHVLALDYLLKENESRVFNCGYSRGYSVLQVVEAAKRVTKVDFPVRFEGRREGDPPALVADAGRIKRELGFEPKHDDLEYIIETAWRWEKERMRRGL